MLASPPPGLAATSDAELLGRVARQDRVPFAEFHGRDAGRIMAHVRCAGASAPDAYESAIAAREGLPLGAVKSCTRLAFGRLRAALVEDLAEGWDDG